jgi:hypothetical protein
MTWTNGKLVSATILSKLGNTCRLRTKVPVDIKLGTNYVDAPMVVPGLYQFPTFAGSNYTITAANVLETENLSATTSGDAHATVTNAAFSSWRATQLSANAANAYVTYTVPNLSAGTYHIHVGADAGANRGRFQLACGPESSPLTNVGAVQDTYSATNVVYLLPIMLSTPTNRILLWTNMLKEFECGTWQAPANGNYQFRFTAVDKNASSSGYVLSLDYVKLTPAASEPLIPPTLSVAGYPGDVVLTWSTNAAGFTLEYTTNLISNGWIPALPPSVVVGQWAVVTNTSEGEGRFYRLRKP